MSNHGRRYGFSYLKFTHQLLTILPSQELSKVVCRPWMRRSLYSGFQNGAAHHLIRSFQVSSIRSVSAFAPNVRNRSIRHSNVAVKFVPLKGREQEKEKSEDDTLSTRATASLSPNGVFDSQDLPACGPEVVPMTEGGVNSDLNIYKRIDFRSLLPLLATAASLPNTVTKADTSVEVPAGFLEVWTGTADKNSFYLFGDESCTARVVPHEMLEDMRRIQLIGTKEARDTGRRKIQELVYSGTVDLHHDYEERTPQLQSIRAQDIPRPGMWTTRSFYAYIRRITRARLGASKARSLYQGSDSFAEAVINVLSSIFLDAEIVRFASTAALRCALQFCRRHPNYPEHVSSICRGFLAAGLEPDIDCFNEELGRLLAINNVTGSKQLLSTMIHQRTGFNDTTWAIILRAVDEPLLRQQFLQIIKQQGHLEYPKAKQKIAAAWCDDVLRSIRDEPDSVAMLTEHMNQIFGKGWLSPAALTNILKASCTNPSNLALTTAASGLATAAFRNGLHASSNCLQQLIRVYINANNLDPVLDLLKTEVRCFDLYNKKPQVATMIFTFAWRKKMLNLCRLLWQTAAAAGNITHTMSHKVKLSATQNSQQGSSEMVRAWNLIAGKLILHANLDNVQLDEIFPTIYSGDANCPPVVKLMQWTPNDGARHEQMQLAQLLVERDLNAWKHYRPIARTQFLELLEQAVQLDQKWLKDDVMTTQPGTQLVQQLLPILLERIDTNWVHGSAHDHTDDRQRWFGVNGKVLDKDNLV